MTIPGDGDLNATAAGLVDEISDDFLSTSLFSARPPGVARCPDVLDEVGQPTQGLDVGAEPVPGFRLVARIGRGGSGEVWRAIGPGGFPVAMKFIALRGRDASEELRSLELMKAIRHANLLPLFGAWQQHGRLIVGMELADGTLMDRLREAIGGGAPGIPSSELIELMQQAARGLDFLNEPRHALLGREGVGIQHGDVKPQNLLVVGGCAKVGDFGLVRADDGVDHGRDTLTPAYASPEVIRGGSSDRSDQYSLAVTYCQLRGGRLPFVGSPAVMMAGHLVGRPDLTMLPMAERPVVARALSREPEGRWPDCRAFVEELTALGEDRRARRGRRPAQDTPGPSPAGSPQSIARRPIGRIAAATGVLLVLLALATRPEMPRDLGGRPGLAPVMGQVTAEHRGDADRRRGPDATSEAIVRAGAEAWKALRVDSAARFQHLGQALTSLSAPLRRGLSGGGGPRPGPSADRPDLEPERPMTALVGATEAPRAVGGPGEDDEGLPTSKTSTITVLMPGARAELVVRGDVGRGNPDEWYGPQRTIHTPPMDTGKDYLVGAFWTDATGRPRTRSRELTVRPGRTYEVDLRASEPSWKEVSR